jgi:hypothetical protein
VSADLIAPVDRGPCRRVGCGCIEQRHWHHRPGDDCGTCGRLVCPGYRPPRTRDARRRCYWCGVRRREHADLGPEAVLLGPGICPTWMAAPPWPVRALTGLTGHRPKHARRPHR